jgi:hypothetical protein
MADRRESRRNTRVETEDDPTAHVYLSRDVLKRLFGSDYISQDGFV